MRDTRHPAPRRFGHAIEFFARPDGAPGTREFAGSSASGERDTRIGSLQAVTDLAEPVEDERDEAPAP